MSDQGRKATGDNGRGTRTDRKEESDHEDLFRPPPSRPECPICLLPMPIDATHVMYMSCCGKSICIGCIFENDRVVIENNRERSRKKLAKLEPLDGLVEPTCPFCREIMFGTPGMEMARYQKRMRMNDADAICQMAMLYLKGEPPVDIKNDGRAFELYCRAAELGSALAYVALADFYYGLHGESGSIVKVDKEKAVMYLKMAARAGHIEARYSLGMLEYGKGNIQMAHKHWRLSASAGHETSLDDIKIGYLQGHMSRDLYTETLRSFCASRKAGHSEDRERAIASIKKMQEQTK